MAKNVSKTIGNVLIAVVLKLKSKYGSENMSIKKYLFWLYEIQETVNNLDNINLYRESKWLENLSFKGSLDDNIKIVDELLGFKALSRIDNLKIKLKKSDKKLQ